MKYLLPAIKKNWGLQFFLIAGDNKTLRRKESRP